MSLARIGEFTVDRVAELEFPAFPIFEFFPACTPEVLAAARKELAPHLIAPDTKLLMSFQSFILRTGRHTILIDTCCGNGKARPARPEFSMLDTPYLANLAKAGLAPEDVDFVMCTHLHWDHVGWNTRRQDGRWVPTFPNARYIMARREYEFWDGVYSRKEENMHALSFEDSVLPIMRAEKAVSVDDGYELQKGIWLEPCHGHTMGNVVINVKSGDTHGVFSGDVLHHQIQLHFPQLACRADTDMNMSRKTRQALVEKHADTGTIFMPAHFPMPTAGRIASKGEAFRFVGI